MIVGLRRVFEGMQFRDRICCSLGGCLSWIEINKALIRTGWSFFASKMLLSISFLALGLSAWVCMVTVVNLPSMNVRAKSSGT